VAPLALLIALVVGGIVWIRRHRPATAGALVSTATNAGSEILTAAAGWFERGVVALRAHTQAQAERVFGKASHRAGTAILYVGLSMLWLVSMGLYIARNRNIVMADYVRGVQSGAIAAQPGVELTKLAEVFAPVLVTAVAGAIVAELIGITDHVPFLHGRRLVGKVAIAVATVAFLTPAVMAQLSVARQEQAVALADVNQTIIELKNSTIVPLPRSPSAAEVAAFNDAKKSFQDTVATPMIVEYNSTIGPLGWRTLLPIVAVLLDFALGWAVVSSVLIAWLVVVVLGRALLRLAQSACSAVAFLIRVLGGALMVVLNVTDARTRAPDVPERTTSPPGGSNPSPGGEPTASPRMRPPWDRPTTGPTSSRPATAQRPGARPTVDRFHPFGHPSPTTSTATKPADEPEGEAA
jgi:hypothetical protein